MADKQIESLQTSSAAADSQKEVSDAVEPSLKRSSLTSPSSPSPHKCPRTELLSAPTQTLDAEQDGCAEMDRQELQAENPEEASVSPTPRRKSWRRATISRRSLPALPNPYEELCKGISPSLPRQERLEKLMEAAMRLAIERTQSSLQAVPNTSLTVFEKQVEHMQKEWVSLAKRIRNEERAWTPASAKSARGPAVQEKTEKIQRAIDRLRAESESWEALLNKHRIKAEELGRKVEQGQERGTSLDLTSVAQSSQYHLIQTKPDYNSVLCRQKPMLHTMTMIMDTQCQMVRRLLSIKEQSQFLVKETSGRLAAEAGFQDLSPELIKNHMATLLSSATT